MLTIELFSGTKSFSNVAKSLGHATFTMDNDLSLNPDWFGDVRDFKVNLPYRTDILWASPPCQGFSVAVIGRNWNHDKTPKTSSAVEAMELAERTLEVIREQNPRYWFIENPRGMLRKMPFMERFLKEMGGGTTHCQLLPIRRYTPEANRYLDKLSRMDT